IESKKIKSFETKTWNSCDRVWSISVEDSIEIRNSSNSARVFDVPFTMGVTNKSITAKENTLFHLGSMDWRPNFIGLRNFIREVWPLILEKRNDLELHLAGKNIGMVEQQL